LHQDYQAKLWKPSLEILVIFFFMFLAIESLQNHLVFFISFFGEIESMKS
jgi:hypothetical protein